jgi:hypothetical protein
VKKLFAILSALLSIIFIATGIFLWYGLNNWHNAIQQEYIQQKQESALELDRVLPKMLEDQKILSKYSWLQAHTCTNDAGPILNRLVAWEGQSLDWLSKNPPEHIIDWKRLSKEGDVRINTIPEGEHWMDMGKDTDFSKWNFPFLSSIRERNCWNFTKDSPLEVQKLTTYQNFIDNDISPDGSSLLKVANVMLLQISQPTTEDPTKDLQTVENVLKDVRTLATLCMQSQEIVLMMIGTSILDRESTAFAYLQTNNRAPSDWTVLSAEEVKRLKRLIWSGTALSKLSTPKKHHSIITSEEFSIGRCASIREGLKQNTHLKDTIETEQYAWLTSVLQKGKELGCHLDDVEEIWNNPKLQLTNDPDFSEFWMPNKVLHGYAMVLASMADPDEFANYR